MRTNARIRLPAVVLAGNATASEPTADPCVAFSCTSPIPPPAAAMVMLSALVAVDALASCACTVKLVVPAPVGVPEITPVLGARTRPAGSAPTEIDQV